MNIADVIKATMDYFDKVEEYILRTSNQLAELSKKLEQIYMILHEKEGGNDDKSNGETSGN